MKFSLVAKESVPQNGRFILPEMAPLYLAIGRLGKDDAIKVEEKTGECIKIRDRISTYYGGKRSEKRFGFTVKMITQKDVPVVGFSTLYITKVVEQ